MKIVHDGIVARIRRSGGRIRPGAVLVSACLSFALAAVGSGAPASRPADSTASARWVYVNNWLGDADDERRLTELIGRIADAGYDTIQLACGIERCGSWDEERKARFGRVRALCGKRGVEIVPSLWSMGYGSPLWKDFNFAEGLPVTNVRFKVSRPFADFVPDRAGNLLANGGFELAPAGRNLFPGWDFVDNPGEVAHADDAVRHSGGRSLRMENFAAHPARNGRVCATVAVRPHRQYRLTAWVKTKDLAPARGFRLLALDGRGRTLAEEQFERHAPTEDWRRLAMLFNSADNAEVKVYAGIWAADGGAFWLDDLELTELGMVEPLRRAGTPFAVRTADGRVLEEGKDYEPVRGVRYGARIETVSQRLRILPGSALRDGDELTVDYYHPVRLAHGQIPVCMSERALYAYFRETAADVQRLCAPRRWFLDLDEIRGGGTCAACAAKGTDMAHILADCVREQFAAIRAVNPDAEIWAWSDMFDPLHNARDGYYACRGTYAGVWDLLPRDLGIVCWHGGLREKSLSFFSRLGHRTLAAGYYDADDVKGDVLWAKACARTPGCVGLMYTTWENRYDLLEEFIRATRSTAAKGGLTEGKREKR